MVDLSQIKNVQLRDFLVGYMPFTSLSEVEKSDYLKKLIILSDDEQLEVFNFLSLENEKEKLAVLERFSEKITELTNKLQTLKRLESEESSGEVEEQEMEEILKEIT